MGHVWVVLIFEFLQPSLYVRYGYAQHLHTKVSEKNEQLQFSKKKKVLIKNCIGWETNFFLINSTILTDKVDP